MKVAIASDHGGFDLKETVKKHLDEKGYEVKDFGCFDKSSCDYPDFGRPAAEAVAAGECELGVLICTTGIDSLSASLTRQHNNANVLVLGAAIVGELLALNIVDTFFDTPFSNAERHQRRVDKIEVQ